MGKEWMDKPRHSREYLEGLNKFLQHAFSSSSPRSQGQEELHKSNQKKHHGEPTNRHLQEEHRGEPTNRHLDNMLSGDDSIIRRKAITPRVPSRSTTITRHEASIAEEENLVDRDVILYAVLRSDIPMAKATVVSIDPSSSVGGQPLGIEFYEVVVNVVLKRDALLPCPYDDMQSMADVQYTSIAWPNNRQEVCYVQYCSMDNQVLAAKGIFWSSGGRCKLMLVFIATGRVDTCHLQKS